LYFYTSTILPKTSTILPWYCYDTSQLFWSRSLAFFSFLIIHFQLSFGFDHNRISAVLFIRISDGPNGISWCVVYLILTINDPIIGCIFNTVGVYTWRPILPLSSTWSHVVETWSSTNGIRIYINGALTSTNPTATTCLGSSASNYLTIGNSLASAGGCIPTVIDTHPLTSFTGDIHDFRVYSRELNETEILIIHRQNHLN